jgi:hypothetical protein
MGSGFKTFTAGAVLTASDVNNYLMEQAVMRFATTGARDTALSGALEDGMTAYVGSNDENEGLYIYNGASWTRPWNMPWGIVSYLQNTSTGTQTMVTNTVVTSLTGTMALTQNRRYRATFQVNQAGANAVGSYAIQDAGAAVGGTAIQAITAGLTSNTVIGVIYFVSGTTSSRTVRVVGTSVANTAVLEVSGTIRQSLLVEDIGPSGAPV